MLTGPVLLIDPPADTDLTGLPGPVAIFHDHQPDHDMLARRHPMRDAIAGPAGSVVLSLPRSRTAQRDRIAEAAALGVPVLVDGQKTDGIDTALKAARAAGRVGAVISKAHGKLFVIEGGDFSGWKAAPGRVDGFAVPTGGFSTDGIDPGSAALIAALPPLKGHVIDLGAGWGALSRAVLSHAAVTRLDLVESHRPSLDCARANLADPRAAFHWADATAWRPAARADHVVANPPFHRGRAGDPDLGRAFLDTAAASLTARGTLWLVANRHLPYERHLSGLFAEIEELSGSPAYKLFRAARPRRPR